MSRWHEYFKTLITVFLVIVLTACKVGNNENNAQESPKKPSDSELNYKKPIANAGDDRTIEVDTAVILDGSKSSSSLLGELAYEWTIDTAIDQYGNNLNIVDFIENADRANPVFTPQAIGSYTISLIVNDGQANSLVDTITILVIEKTISFPAPGGLSAVSGYSKVSLTWQPLINAIEYLIYRSESEDVSTDGDILTTVKSASYIDSGLVNDVRYFYQVVAIDQSGVRGSDSRVVMAIPGQLIDLALFSDTQLRACVRKKDTKITQEITALNCSTYRIKNLEGIEQLRYLISLDLSDNDVASIESLSGLSRLTNINLSFNPFTDLSPLSNLTSLTNLYLKSNMITDITPLNNLVSLVKLDLSSNRIDNVSPLNRMLALKELRLEANQIEDISALSTLSMLTHLSLSDNQIVDVLSLSKLIKLTDLLLSNNKVVDVLPLQELIELESLYLNSNQIEDVSKLISLSSAKDINLKSNPSLLCEKVNLIDAKLDSDDGSNAGIVVWDSCETPVKLWIKPDDNQLELTWDVVEGATEYLIYRDLNRAFITIGSPFAQVDSPGFVDSGLINGVRYYYEVLAVLADGQQISLGQVNSESGRLIDLSLFTDDAFRACVTNTQKETIRSLTQLECSDTSIHVLNGMEQLVALKSLSIRNRQIVDLSPLRSLSELDYLDMSWNQIVDLSPLSDLSSLKSLYLSSNKISNIHPLRDLPELIYLDLSDNLIKDVTFGSMAKLTRLALNSNQIVDISPLSELSSLTFLNLENNQVVDTSILTGLTLLENLNLRSNKIATPIFNDMLSLRNLNLSDNQIMDISLLSGLDLLNHLNLVDNLLVDVLPLSGLSKAGYLDIHLQGNTDLPCDNVAILKEKLSTSNVWIWDSCSQ